MTFDRRKFLAGSAALAGATGIAPASADAASWESLARDFRVPDWFADAKFGIYAHWGPQCQPEFGDWYARKMYIQGDPAYADHVARYGHPSRTGFMDIIGQWQVEQWKPEELLDLYSAAGAKYLVALACHHDNFDNFDSSNPWNAVKVGPKKDIIGTWRKLTRERGMHFGASNHSGHAWHWYQTAYGYDAEGPDAGKRYDASHLTKADGEGRWWEGLDPQALYTGPSMPAPDGIKSINEMVAWHDAHDRVWTENPPPANPAFVQNWSQRCREMIDKYDLDLLYFDDTGLPLGQAGLDIAQYYYGGNIKKHGRLEGIVTGKLLTPVQRRSIMEDVERGAANDIRPVAWQTDTCIGDWHYDRRIFARHGYKSVKTVAQNLCDVISKNGNLLLSIPIRGNGEIDADERQFLQDFAAWMKPHAEGIFASRPWKQFGEGPVNNGGGMMTENSNAAYTPQDLRFTVNKGALYAWLMHPAEDGKVTIRALAVGKGKVERVTLPGTPGALAFVQDQTGLHFTLPGEAGRVVPGVRIDGRGIA